MCVSPAEVGAQSGTMAGTMGRARPTMGRARSALPQWEEWATRPPTNNSHRCHFRSRGCPFHPGPCQARQEKKMQRNHWMSPPTRLFMCPTAPTHATKPKLYKFIRLESDHPAFFPLVTLVKNAKLDLRAKKDIPDFFFIRSRYSNFRIIPSRKILGSQYSAKSWI